MCCRIPLKDVEALFIIGAIGGYALLCSSDEYPASTGGSSYDTGIHCAPKYDGLDGELSKPSKKCHTSYGSKGHEHSSDEGADELTV